MRTKFVYLVIALVVISSLVLAACGATPAPGAKATPKPGDIKKGGTLTLSLGPEFPSFDPYYDVDNLEFKPVLFDSILRISDDGTKYEPWLAESWQEGADGKSLTLKLRQGVKWHNGRTMTADDLLWSLQYAMDTKPGHHRSDYYQTVEKVEKAGADSVKITYKSIDPSKYNALSQTFIFPQEALKDIASKPVGSGPFKLQEWVPGDHLTLVKNPDYWVQGKPYLDKVIVKPMPDQQSRIANLKAGSIDLLMGVPLADVSSVGKTKGLVTFTQPPGSNFFTVMINVTRPPFDKQEVRQAMMYALDRDKIGKTAMHGVGEPALLPYAKTSWAYDESLSKMYKYDINKAKDLLKQAGFPNGVKGSMMIRGIGNVYVDIAQVYQADLAKAGINVELKPTDLAQYFPLLYESNFDMVMHGTGEADLDPSGLFVGAACCRPFRNFMKITENKTWFPTYEKTVYAGRDELDQTKRKAIYKDALTILMQQAWIIPIYWNQQTFAFKDFVKGFRTDSARFIWLTDTFVSK